MKRSLLFTFSLLTLSACASTSTPHAQSPQQATVSTPQALSEPYSPPTSSFQPNVAERPIKGGDSVSGRSTFHLTDGRLAPWLDSWAQEVSITKELPLEFVQQHLQAAQYNASAARLMAPSKGRVKRSWITYRERFVDPIRINAGVKFWQQNQGILNEVEQTYGVPASIIVAIIGVETIYGRYTGDFKVLDALATLGFSYPDDSRPERGALFRDQLADLLVLDYQGKIKISEAYGSYAGAMGLPQFMPGSIKRFAVDYTQKGYVDLYRSIPDITASVANFLRVHGWQPGLPSFVKASLPKDPASLVTGGLQPTLSWQQLSQAGAHSTVEPLPTWLRTTKLGVINLVDEPSQNVQYRIATPNFYALTHYNRSYFYATSVVDLAAELERNVKAAH